MLHADRSLFQGEQEEYASEDVFISHAGQQKDTFAVHLRRELQRRGISVFLDERDMRRGQHATSRMKAACTGAMLVIFVVTHDFLRSSWCLDELRWALAEREKSGGRLPAILPVLYPAESETVDIDDLDPLSPELSALLPFSQTAQPIRSQLVAPLATVALAGAARVQGADMRLLSCCSAASMTVMAWRTLKRRRADSLQRAMQVTRS